MSSFDTTMNENKSRLGTVLILFCLLKKYDSDVHQRSLVASPASFLLYASFQIIIPSGGTPEGF